MAYREGFGNILAEGSHIASQLIGRGAESCLVEVKGMETSSFYPGYGTSITRSLGFATAPIGGSLHRGGSIHVLAKDCPRFVKVLGKEMAERISGGGKVYAGQSGPKTYDGQGALLAIHNNWLAVQDALSCRSLGELDADGVNEDVYAQLVSTLTGVEIDGDGIMKVGDRIFNVEKAFNLREGIRRKDDTLPERFFTEITTPEGTSGLNRAKFEEQLDEYYKYHGWDRDGFPTEKKLAELNLSDVAEQLRGLRR